jgi:hypothetical protein
MTTLNAKWLTINGYRAVMRHELSCITNGDFYITYLSNGRQIGEITTNSPDREHLTKTISFTDEDGNDISNVTVNSSPATVLTAKDAAIHKTVVRAFRFH